MTDYPPDIKKYTANVNEVAVAAIVMKYCGIALRPPDSSMVSATNAKEPTTVRDGFAAKKLGLDAASADRGINDAIEKMKAVNRKNRVTPSTTCWLRPPARWASPDE